MKGLEPLYFSYSFTYKVKLQTDLEECPLIHYVLIYKTIHVYYLNKSTDSLRKSCDQDYTWMLFSIAIQKVEEDSSKLVWS